MKKFGRIGHWPPLAMALLLCCGVLAVVLVIYLGGNAISTRIASASTLSLLQYCGIGLTALTVVWALVVETSYKDELGRKRLTAAGYCALAFAFVSLTLTAVTFTMGAFLRQKDEMQAQSVAERRALEERLSSERADDRQFFRIKAMQDAAAARSALALQAAATETRMTATNQRLLTLATATEQRNRMLGISQDVNRGLQPLEEIQMTVTWVIPGDTPGLSDQTAIFADLGRRIRLSEHPLVNEARIARTAVNERGELIGIGLDRSSPYYPHNGDTLISALQAYAYVIFLAADRPAPGDRGYVSASSGDVGITLSQTPSQQQPLIVYYFDSGDVEIDTYTTRIPSEMLRSGRIPSILDLERATMLLLYLFPDMRLSPAALGLRSAMRPVRVTLRTGGRTYILAADRFHRAGNGQPIYVTRGLGRPL